MNTAQNLRNRLKLRHLEAKDRFAGKHPHAASFFQDVGLDPGQIRQHSARLLAAGALGGALLLPASPAGGPAWPGQGGQGEAGGLKLSPTTSGYQLTTRPLAVPAPVADILTTSGKALPENPQAWLAHQLQKTLSPIHTSWGLPFLTGQEEKLGEKVIQQATGVPVRASLEGEHLNTVYGYIGAEQHLRRFPGDTLAKHEYQAEGMAPGLGAWGYFTEDGKPTQDTIMREKYYVAVQTLYLPDWERRVRYLRDWYKWRKVIVVDADRGTAVVAVVGDAGPAAWTGKHFGGSPEIMHALGGPKYKKGRVLLYFVDDPENKIPLGPVDYNKLNIPIVKQV